MSETEATQSLIRLLARTAVSLGVAEHAFIVGGAVRDTLLCVPVKDVDVVIDVVACNMTSGTFAEALAAAQPSAHLVTNNYGVAILTLGEGSSFEGVDLAGVTIEIANARKESYGGAEGKGYKPHLVENATIEEDVVRREFRFNTLLWRLSDLLNGTDNAPVIDHTGHGVEDLRQRRMVCPADPHKVFSDDPTRMLRAIKFGIRFGFRLGMDERNAICVNASKLLDVPQNAVATILTENILNVDFQQGMTWLGSLGLIPTLRELATRNPEFRSTLTNWGRSRPAAMLALVLDAKMPVAGNLQGLLDTCGLEDLRKHVERLGEEKGLALIDALRQPGKVMDTQAIAKKRGLAGSEIRVLMKEARSLLLEQPELMDGGLNEAMRL